MTRVMRKSRAVAAIAAFGLLAQTAAPISLAARQAGTAHGQHAVQPLRSFIALDRDGENLRRLVAFVFVLIGRVLHV